jgi:diguanylate cyclase (GGDEF)-like protein
MEINRLHLIFYRCSIWRDIVSHLGDGWTCEEVSDLRSLDLSESGEQSPFGDDEQRKVAVVSSFEDAVYWEYWMEKNPQTPVFQVMAQGSGMPVKGMADFLTVESINHHLATRLLFATQKKLDAHQVGLSHQKMLKDRRIQMELNDRLLKVSVELKEAKDRIEELSMTDALTQVKNRRFFDFQIARDLLQSSRYQTSLSLFIMDIDNFKYINDTFGHPVGDEVLVNLGEIIRTCLRDTDWAARYGGEEFVVVLPMTGEDGALRTAERLRKRVETELSHLEGETFTVSVGVATFNEESNKEVLVRQADESLYKAKKTGKNKVVYFNEAKKECCEYTS